MRHKIILILFLLISGSIFSSCSKKTISPKDFTSETPQFVKPKTNEWTYSNGLKIVHFYYPELPLVNISYLSKNGRLFNSEISDGVKSATISLLKDGGAGNYPPDTLDEKLDSLATNIGVGQDSNSTVIEMSCLSEDVNEAFSIFSDVIFRPRFDQTRFNLWRDLVSDGINRRKDSKETLAELSFSNIIFDGKAPWYSPITKADLAKININSLKQYHNTLFNPQNSILYFVGAISETEIKDLVEKEFKNWKTNSSIVTEDIPVPKSMDAGIYILNSDFEQTEVLLGFSSPKNNEINPYHQALFNKAFGQGSFSSVLFQEIRDNLGLAYDISGGFDVDKNMEMFKVSLGTKSEQSIKAIEEVLKLLGKLKSDGISSSYIDKARLSALQTYIFKFSEPDALAKRDTLIELYGLPSDWDTQYQTKISKTTEADIKEFSKKFLRVDDLRIIVIGKVSSKEVKEHFPHLKVCDLEFKELPSIKGCL